METRTPAYLQYDFPIELSQEKVDELEALVEHYKQEESDLDDEQFRNYLLLIYWSHMEESQFKAVLYVTLQDIGVIKKPQ